MMKSLRLCGQHDASLRGWHLGVQQPVMLQAIWQQTIQERAFAFAVT